MARLNLYKLQERRKVQQGGVTYEMVKNLAEPIRINHGEGPPVWLWDGKAFDDSGSEMDPDLYPSWFWDHVKRLGPKSLQKVGWNVKVAAHFKSKRTPPRTEEQPATRRAS